MKDHLTFEQRFVKTEESLNKEWLNPQEYDNVPGGLIKCLPSGEETFPTAWGEIQGLDLEPAL